VRVVGSVARGDDGADSDIDLLVEIEDNRSPLDLVGLEQDLQISSGSTWTSDRGEHPSRPSPADHC
jgi:predicted nucleotidyltransferase